MVSPKHPSTPASVASVEALHSRRHLRPNRQKLGRIETSALVMLSLVLSMFFGALYLHSFLPNHRSMLFSRRTDEDLALLDQRLDKVNETEVWKEILAHQNSTHPCATLQQVRADRWQQLHDSLRLHLQDESSKQQRMSNSTQSSDSGACFRPQLDSRNCGGAQSYTVLLVSRGEHPRTLFMTCLLLLLDPQAQQVIVMISPKYRGRYDQTADDDDQEDSTRTDQQRTDQLYIDRLRQWHSRANHPVELLSPEATNFWQAVTLVQARVTHPTVVWVHDETTTSDFSRVIAAQLYVYRSATALVHGSAACPERLPLVHHHSYLCFVQHSLLKPIHTVNWEKSLESLPEILAWLSGQAWGRALPTEACK